MSMFYGDRLQESTSTTGTGAAVLTGASTGCAALVSAIKPGVRFPYRIEDGSAWETGVGMLTDATHMSRSVVASSNGSALLNLSGAATVAVSLIASAMTRGTICSGQVVPVAMYGDSRADWSDVTDQRILGWTDIDGYRQRSLAAASCMVQSFYPAAQPVACGGVSGDSLAQMVTRETAAASASRKSLADVAATGAKVLFLRAAINTITADVAAGSYNPTTTTGIINAREDLIRRAIALGLFVVDEGEWGFDYVGDASGWPQSRIDNVRTTIQAINQAAMAFALANPQHCAYLPAWHVLTDGSTGQWLSGMCADNASPGYRVHLTSKGGAALASIEAAMMRSLFGDPEPQYTAWPERDYPSAAQNATLAQSSGGLATGYTTSVSGAGASKVDEIVTLDGKRWQVCKAQFSGAGTNTVQIELPLPITGGSPTVPVENGDVYVFEADVLIDDGSGGAPPGPLPGSNWDQYLRVAFETSNGGNYLDALIPDGQSNVSFSVQFMGRVSLGPVRIPMHSAGLSSAYWRLKAATSIAVTGGTYLRIGVSEPRIVKVPRNSIPLPLMDIDEPEAKALGFNDLRGVKPASGTTAASATSGWGVAFTNAGTIANPTPASTNRQTSRRRTTFDTGTTSGALASHRCAVLDVWRGNASGLGGFRFKASIAVETLASGRRQFVGVIDSVSAPSNVNPTTSTSGAKVGLACDASTGNWKLIHNTAGSAPTVLDLGSAFAINTTDVLTLWVYCPPAASYIDAKVRNETSGRVFKARLTTNLPAATAFLAPMLWSTNNATSASDKWAFYGWDIELKAA